MTEHPAHPPQVFQTVSANHCFHSFNAAFHHVNTWLKILGAAAQTRKCKDFGMGRSDNFAYAANNFHIVVCHTVNSVLERVDVEGRTDELGMCISGDIFEDELQVEPTVVALAHELLHIDDILASLHVRCEVIFYGLI